uniref:Uncharacterized protein n=1 Tax=Micrurus lemniscatus lemniscatus TaxID=129467 RepID=A0A2D4JID9_MICLE
MFIGFGDISPQLSYSPSSSSLSGQLCPKTKKKKNIKKGFPYKSFPWGLGSQKSFKQQQKRKDGAFMHIIWLQFNVDKSKNSTLRNENIVNSTSQRGEGINYFLSY